MKKLLVLIVTLGILAVLPLAAINVRVSEEAQGLEAAGEFWMFGNYDFSDPATAISSFLKAEINFNYKLDEFTKVQLELDSEGTAWTAGGPTLEVDDWRIVSDLGGAFKLPVKLTATFGYFDTYFTDWDYVSESGWESYFPWPNLLATDGPDKDGAWQVDVGVGPVTLHWWNDLLCERMMAGVSAAMGPLSGWVTYQDTFINGFGKGTLGVEAKYAGKFGDIGLTVPALFRYDLLNTAWVAGAGVGVDYKIFRVAFGLEGDNVKFPDRMVAELKATPMEGLKAAAIGYFKMSDPNAFTAAVIEVRKSIGKLWAVLGYVIGGQDKTAIPLYDDNWEAVSNGLYFGVAATY